MLYKRKSDLVVNCDQCGNDLNTRQTNEMTARSIARRNGWRCDADRDEDTCDTCKRKWAGIATALTPR